jgi:hypothetical protein
LESLSFTINKTPAEETYPAISNRLRFSTRQNSE